MDIGQFLEPGGETVIVVLACAGIIGWCISASFLLCGAAITGIENRSYGRALGATFSGAILGSGISFVVVYFVQSSNNTSSADPVLVVAAGSLAGLLVYILMIQAAFGTSFGKACGAFVMNGILAVLFYGTIAAVVMATMGDKLQAVNL